MAPIPKYPGVRTARVTLALVAMAASVSSARNVVDLSYQHHLGPNSIAHSVEQGVMRAASPGDGEAEVEIDVSSTLIGDEGCEFLAGVFQKCRESISAYGTQIPSPTEITLSARMNRISAAGASTLLDAITHVGRTADDGGGEVAETGDSSGAPTSSDEKGESDNVTSTSVEGNHTAAGTNDDAQKSIRPAIPFYVSTIDLGLNDLGHHHHREGGRGSAPSRSFAKTIRSIIEGSPSGTPSSSQNSEDNKSVSACSICPKVIRLDRCGLGPSACRAIGKGLIKSTTCLEGRRRLECLHLSGNDLIGDSGAAALAAALRTAPRSRIDGPLLEVLDLSSCGIGDAGAEALALALKDNPGCVGRLDLSQNRIADDGAIAIGSALARKKGKQRHPRGAEFVMEKVDLSGNKDLGDDGAAALAAAVECGALRSISIRSCSVRSDGAAALGKALLAFSTSKSRGKCGQSDAVVVNVDLSGNELGTLRAKAKSKPYSASLLKSKASATTASYMNFIGKKIKSGLKDAGLDMGSIIPSSESDDEEEAMMGLDQREDQKSASARCGARSFSEAFTGDDGKESSYERSPCRDDQKSIDGVKYIIGMRQTSLDEGAADALAAVIVRGRDKFGIDVTVDANMNDALEERSISALQGGDEGEVLLRSMAKRHLDAVRALRIACQRAAEAAEAAAARARAEEMMSSAFGGQAEDSEFGSAYPGDPDEYFDDEYAY